MNTHFKSALSQIKAEDELVNKTELYLRDALSNTSTPKVRPFKKSSMRKAIIAAASFFIIIIAGGSGAYAYYQTPTAYLCLDINPSVELGVNAFGTVVKAEGYNEDGESILNGTDVTGNSVENAVQILILSANDKGFIANDGSTVISLTSETNNTDKATTLQNNSESGVNSALAEIDKQAVVQKDNVALDRRDEARDLGITPGKLNLINKLQAVDPDAAIEEYKDSSVKDIMKALNDSKNKENPDAETKATDINGNNSNNNPADPATVETKSINDNKSDDATKENADKSNANSNTSGVTNDKKTDSTSVDSNNGTDKGNSGSNNGTSDSNSNNNDKNKSDNKQNPNGDKGNSADKSNNSETDLNSNNSKK